MIDLYEITEEERKLFAEHWCIGNEEKFPHGIDLQVAVYEPTNPDGERTIVSCSAWPARFYSIETDTLKITTGSDMYQLAADIAKALSEGMLRIKKV